MKNTLDPIDRRIVELLQNNGKLKIKDIAEKLGMTTTPTYERIKKIEQNGYIKGYTATVDNEKMGFDIVAYCSISLEKHNHAFIEQFIEEVAKLDEVLECYHIAGMFDYLLKVYATDMKEYQDFIANKLASLKNIGKVQSSFVMSEIKSKKALPIVDAS